MTEWYKLAFGSNYPIVYAHRNDEDAEAQVKLIREICPLHVNASVLDLACGYGRHLKYLENYFSNLTGLDLSRDLLSIASKQLTQTNLIRADIRHLPLKGQFDLILNLFTSFGYFSNKENRIVFEQLCQYIKPNGLLWFDTLNSYKLPTEPVIKEQFFENLTIKSKSQYNPHLQRVRKLVQIFNSKQLIQEYTEDVQCFDKNWFSSLSCSKQLILEHHFGNYAGEAYTKESPRSIYILRKKS